MKCPHCGLDTEIADSVPYRTILCDWNSLTGQKLKGGHSFNRLVRARWMEGHRRPDFQTVIINMVRAWGNDPSMSIYIRPTTLFGSKFDSYLNRIQPQVQQNNGLGEGMVW